MSVPIFSNHGENLGFKLGAGLRVTPYAKLEAFAQLAIDLVVVSAGVEIVITIIDVSLPFTASLVLNGNLTLPSYNDALGYLTGEDDILLQNGGLTLSLNMSLDTNLDLVLRTLDGKISLFVKVDLWLWEETYRKQLADWNGFDFSTNIFEYSLQLGDTLGYSIPIGSWNFANQLSEIDLNIPGSEIPNE